jgi:heme exporter protein D
MENLLPEMSYWLARWIEMGGYAAFVWPAYAVASVVLGGLAAHSWRAHRVSEAALGRLTRRADNNAGGRRR